MDILARYAFLNYWYDSKETLSILRYTRHKAGLKIKKNKNLQKKIKEK